MTASLSSLTAQEAWQPLRPEDWNESAARHLLRRVGFTSTPGELDRCLREGPARTLSRYFAQMPVLTKPQRVVRLEREGPDFYRRLRSLPPEERRAAQREAREKSREALQDLILGWLQLAAQPENSPGEKWLLFLSDVWVVSVEKVKNTALIFQHQELLRRHALGKAPALAKAMTRSPAMVVYLDLQQSGREAPNENFARELFELFTLGEGHYSEADIKQAARAFTGYRQRDGEFIFVKRQHDDGVKTVFGQTRAFGGDDIVDLVYQQPAAASFLPQELIRFYLSDAPLPAAHVAALGDKWAATGFDLRELALLFFGSRAFYAPEFRGSFIKSPIQFYLGLLQDLELDVVPLPRSVLGALRQMGQLPFDPPNVRGWVGGKAWINSATLAVRRQVINAVLQPLDESKLNADELFELSAAEANGRTRFALDETRLRQWANLPPREAAGQLLARSLPDASPAAAEQLTAFLDAGESRPATVRAALAALLESPAYQLC